MLGVVAPFIVIALVALVFILMIAGCAGHGSLAWEDPMPKETPAEKTEDARIAALQKENDALCAKMDGESAVLDNETDPVRAAAELAGLQADGKKLNAVTRQLYGYGGNP